MRSPIQCYLAQIQEQLPFGGSHKARIMSEIETHLLESLEDEQKRGIPAEETFALVLERFGSPTLIGQQFAQLERLCMRVEHFHGQLCSTRSNALQEEGEDMITERQAKLMRWFILASLVLFILSSVLQFLRYPAIVRDGGSEVRMDLLLFVLALLIYGWFALFRTCTRTGDGRIALHQGSVWGSACGVVWSIELLIANLPLIPSKPLMIVLYDGTVWLGFLLPVIPSLLASWQTGRISRGLQAGWLCGMMGGLMIFLTWLLFSIPLFREGVSDPQTMSEFRQSGLPDITTYIVSDWLAALIAHLWIGLITGLLLGVLGGIVGKGVHRLKRRFA